MGKTLKTIVGVAAIVASQFVPGLNVVVAAALLSAGTSLTLSGVSEIIAGTPKSPGIEDSGQRLTLTTNPAAPREICYGKAATGGNLIFRDTVGSNNSDLWMVTAIAGHEIESIEEVEFGGVTTTFSGNNAIGNLNNFWFQFEHLGTDTQTVDTNLDAASTKWTTNHRLRGAAYIVNQLIFDQDKFPKGLEQIKYIIKGKKLYDPRLDTTQGGSGLHRFADKSTWAFSENPVLCLVDYLRGETQNGKLIWGMGQVETAFDWPSTIAEANICEEQITLKAGGTEDRYTCNGFLNSSDRHETNIRAILSSCAGNLVWQSGKWRIYVGAARTATKTRVENQFIGPVKYIPKKEYQKRSNAIRGLYNDPEAGYEAKDYPPVINSTFVTEDGGQELWGDLNLPMTKSKATAQRLANIALRQARMEKIFSGTLNTIGFEDQAQDSVNLTYSRFNLSNQKMIISDWALRFQQDENNNVGLVVEETFIETDDNIYAWTAATDEATIPTVVDLFNPQPQLLNWSDVDRKDFDTDKFSWDNEFKTFDISGTPEKDATKNVLVEQPDEPPAATDGDMWIDTSSSNRVSRKFVDGSFSISSTEGAILGTNLIDTIGTPQGDAELKNIQQEWDDVQDANITRPADNATLNIGILADLNSVDTAEIDTNAVTTTDFDTLVTLTPTATTNTTILTLTVTGGTSDAVELVISTKNAFFTFTSGDLVFKVIRTENAVDTTVIDRAWIKSGDIADAETKSYVFIDDAPTGGFTLTYKLQYRRAGGSIDATNDRIREIYFRARQIKR